ncbi:hypothetical protein GDO86_017592, partial [Hymenochirus boettgeri]
METSCSTNQSSEARQGRSEKRTFPRKREESGGGSISDVSASPLSPYRRAKSLDRRSTESSMTPDLLNFKKGWLTKQCEGGQWKKHWFVLTDQTLRYYQDSVAEEAADLDGEIDLSTCYDVTEYPVQRNYGFQIHTKEGEFTLSAMTSGIRRNWIQTIMKHVRPNTAPDVTSSLPEEKSKTSSSFSSAQTEKQDSEHSDADVEQKRSRARERRREGRSKTFDWAEFRPIQQALAQERAQAVEAMKSVSSYTTDSKNDIVELERERARRREERRKRFESSDSVEESAVEDISRMEIDRGLALSENLDIRPNVHVEIEQRWQQVETTPLREEKQKPIAPLPVPSSSLIHPTDDITALLQKQLEQSQKEVATILEENLVLQQRLKEALEQQQNARDGYVLQTELADPMPDAWQRLHKVNEDLCNELESQCKRQEMLNQHMQAIKHSYGEAKDSIRHQEAEILSLQARLSSAYAELAIKEQAFAKLKIDLTMEKEKAKETFEEWQTTEAALSAQLRDSQQKLNQAESLLLEKCQQIRELELEQALQRDHQKEMQRLEDKLADLRSQLDASEQARVQTEERLKGNYEDLLGNYEKEKQVLLHNLKETEDKLVEYENKVQENDQLVEIAQKEKLSANAEISIIVHHLEEQLGIQVLKVQKLEEYVTELEGCQERMKASYQELTNRLGVSDSENANLQNSLGMLNAENCDLRSSLERANEQLVKVKATLMDKEGELRLTSKLHTRVVAKKEQDINEAIIKMAALGSSLEETEIKLKAKEEALRRIHSYDMEAQAMDVEDLCLQLQDAKHRIAELEQNRQVHRGDSACKILERDNLMEISQSDQPLSLNDTDTRTFMVSGDFVQESVAKRPRIRFSNIQCQKYVNADGSEKNWSSNSRFETSQIQPICEDRLTPETNTHYQSSLVTEEDTYLSLIQSLETKLYDREEKLKLGALKLENQKCYLGSADPRGHASLASEGYDLVEQLQGSSTQIVPKDQLGRVDQREPERCLAQDTTEEVFSSLESCRTMLKDLLNHKDNAELFYSTLSRFEAALNDCISSLQHSQKTGVLKEGAMDPYISTKNQHSLCEDSVQKLSEKIGLQVKLIHGLAEALRLSSDEDKQGVWHDAQNVVCGEPSFVEILAKQIELERDFWSQVEKLGKGIMNISEEEVYNYESNTGSCSGPFQILANKVLLKAELSWVNHKMEYY